MPTKSCEPANILGEIIVQLKDASKSTDTIFLLKSMEGVNFEETLFDDPELRIFLISVPEGQEGEFIRQFKRIPNVAEAEANQIACFAVE